MVYMTSSVIFGNPVAGRISTHKINPYLYDYCDREIAEFRIHYPECANLWVKRLGINIRSQTSQGLGQSLAGVKPPFTGWERLFILKNTKIKSSPIRRFLGSENLLKQKKTR